MGKPLDECSREELVEIIKCQKETISRTKKFGLVWEDKPEKVATDCAKKLPVIKEVADKAISKAGDSEPTNIIIEGDNYHALSVLNYTHANRVDVIYIDPPYNTGNKDFRYNDNYVDKEDAFRHSKWLSFMKKRLELSRSLLSDNGVIFISIDDNEFAQLKLLCDKVFKEANYHGMLTWPKKTKPVNMGSAQYSLQSNIEYVLVYGAKPQEKHNYYLPEVSPKTYPFSDEGGEYRVDRIDQRKNLGSMRRDSMVYEMFGIRPKDGYRWQLSPQKRDQLMSENRLFEKKGSIYIKTYKEFEEKKSGLEPFWTHRADVPTAESAKEELEKMMGEDDIFQTVKPTELIRQILLFSTKDDSIVLDFFAGSGTTGQAVLELNKEDGKKRTFILCTDNENGIAEEVTAPRIKTVITGTRPDGSRYSSGIAANVRYFKTDFIDKNDTMDKLRRELSPACEDMIRVREGAYEKIIDDDMLKVFKNARGLTAIIYDRFELEEHIKRIEELETDAPVHLYVFSYSKSDRKDEMPSNLKHKYEAQPIPEGVLEIYKKIFANIKGGKNA